MIQILVELMPKNSGWISLLGGITGCLGGGFLWFFGLRGNRNWITLLFVLAGAVFGTYLSPQLHLEVASWAVATVVALICGWIGFVTYRFWSGVALGALIALGSLLAVLAIIHLDSHDVITTRLTGASWIETGRQASLKFSRDEQLMLIVAICSSACAGFIAGMVWYRAAMACLYSVAGFAIFSASALLLTIHLKLAGVNAVRLDYYSIAGISIFAILLGTFVQWKTTGSRLASHANHASLSIGQRPIERLYRMAA